MSLHAAIIVPALRTSLARRLGAAVVGFVRGLVNRRHVRSLLDMSDRELRDIGLTRDDLRGVLALPLVRDPSVALVVRAVDRRSLQRDEGASDLDRRTAMMARTA